MKIKIIVIGLIFSPLSFFGWGAEGHKIVGDVAEKQLKKGVKEKVQKYLGEMTFEGASVWMDEIKSDHSFDYMKQWHYTNIEKGETYHKAAKGDIIVELQEVITELKNYKQMKDEDVNKDLKILFHLCGDITQPLHVGYGSDKGGNEYKVTFNDKSTNLHHLWDSEIIKKENITAESCLMKLRIFRFIESAKKNGIMKVDVVAWMNDSRSLLPSVYDIKENTIKQTYLNTAKDEIETQLAKGGLILSTVLNDIFQ